MTFKTLINETIIPSILDPAVNLLIAVAVVLLLYGVVKYVSSGENEEERKKGKDLIVYGIIGLFVMVSVWGLVNLLAGTFSLETSSIPKPQPYNPQ
jgi:uncharacterized membrane protein YidH (DUF202 family)